MIGEAHSDASEHVAYLQRHVVVALRRTGVAARMVVRKHYRNGICAQREFHHRPDGKVHTVARAHGEPFEPDQSVLRVQSRRARRLHGHTEHLLADVVPHRAPAGQPGTLLRHAHYVSAYDLRHDGKEQRGVVSHAGHALDVREIGVEHIREGAELVHQFMPRFVRIPSRDEREQHIFLHFVVGQRTESRLFDLVPHSPSVSVVCTHDPPPRGVPLREPPRAHTRLHSIIPEDYTLQRYYWRSIFDSSIIEYLEPKIFDAYTFCVDFIGKADEIVQILKEFDEKRHYLQKTRKFVL